MKTAGKTDDDDKIKKDGTPEKRTAAAKSIVNQLIHSIRFMITVGFFLIYVSYIHRISWHKQMVINQIR